MKESYYELLEEVMKIQEKGIEKIQWMLKIVHDFSQSDPLFDESVLTLLCILSIISFEKSEILLEKIKYEKQKKKEILACLKEKDKKEKKYFASKVLADLSLLWEFSRLGKRISGKSIEELHTILENSSFFVHKLKHEAQIQLKQREHD